MPDPVPALTGTNSRTTTSLVHVGQWLQSQDYAFAVVTPATHTLVLRNRQSPAASLMDIFGWNMPFSAQLLPEVVFAALHGGGLIEAGSAGLFRARVRFSTFGEFLFPHSSFPTLGNKAVFFGPDTHRFARLIQRELRERPLPGGARILDVGCGAGAGGIVAVASPGLVGAQLRLSDISAAALEFARASVVLAGLEGVEFCEADLFSGVSGDFDLIVANPPYLNDAAQRLYRHGGGTWGEALSIRILKEGLPRLSRGGMLVLYTGSAIVNGVDHLRHALHAELVSQECDWNYEEIDPDVFGEDLQNPAYASADRLAAVSLVVRKP